MKLRCCVSTPFRWLVLFSSSSEPHELLELIGRKRGCLVKGGIVDTEKAQRIVLTDFRSGKLGTVSLDMPPQDDGMAEDEQ